MANTPPWLFRKQDAQLTPPGSILQSKKDGEGAGQDDASMRVSLSSDVPLEHLRDMSVSVRPVMAHLLPSTAILTTAC